MRALRHLLVVLGALLLLSAGAPVMAMPGTPAPAAVRADTAPVAAPDPKDLKDPDDLGGPHGPDGREPVPCPTTDRVGAHNTPPPPWQRYFQNDWRLGPAQLPRTGPIGRMLKGYERLDHMSSAEFLACYWDDDTSGWWYPSPDGWVLINGTPLHVTVTLQPGQKVDLFGSGFGHFLAPAGTPFAERALPPSNLNTLDPAYPFGYHLYEVTQPIVVEAGPARPWFGQPGLGLQYLTGPSIPQLVTDGKLRPLN
ncbi:TNT domain-containing protein [Streptomyces sparsogenes]|uniref:TNT domain-containing protein n=1 Tax=Streptomyces sparsogenes TaxID=67365 RepID=UPI003401CA5A